MLPGGCVGAGGGFGGLLPNVVNAVELTPNKTMKTANNMVKLPHCVKRFSGSISSINYIFLLVTTFSKYIFIRGSFERSPQSARRQRPGTDLEIDSQNETF